MATVTGPDAGQRPGRCGTCSHFAVMHVPMPGEAIVICGGCPHLRCQPGPHGVPVSRPASAGRDEVDRLLGRLGRLIARWNAGGH